MDTTNQEFLNKKRLKEQFKNNLNPIKTISLETDENNARNHVDTSYNYFKDNENFEVEIHDEKTFNIFNKVKKSVNNNITSKKCDICKDQHNEIYKFNKLEDFLYFCKFLIDKEYPMKSSKFCKKQFYNLFSIYIKKESEFNCNSNICRFCLDGCINFNYFSQVFDIIIGNHKINKFIETQDGNKNTEINKLFDIINKIDIPEIPDVLNNIENILKGIPITNNTDDNIEKLKDMKNGLINFQYNSLIQKLFISYFFKNIEIFLSQLLKCLNISENVIEGLSKNVLNIQDEVFPKDFLMNQVLFMKNNNKFGLTITNELNNNYEKLKCNGANFLKTTSNNMKLKLVETYKSVFNEDINYEDIDNLIKYFENIESNLSNTDNCPKVLSEYMNNSENTLYTSGLLNNIDLLYKQIPK